MRVTNADFRREIVREGSGEEVIAIENTVIEVLEGEWRRGGERVGVRRSAATATASGIESRVRREPILSAPR